MFLPNFRDFFTSLNFHNHFYINFGKILELKQNIQRCQVCVFLPNFRDFFTTLNFHKNLYLYKTINFDKTMETIKQNIQRCQVCTYIPSFRDQRLNFRTLRRRLSYIHIRDIKNGTDCPYHPGTASCTFISCQDKNIYTIGKSYRSQSLLSRNSDKHRAVWWESYQWEYTFLFSPSRIKTNARFFNHVTASSAQPCLLASLSIQFVYGISWVPGNF